ncbi:NAD P-binding protein [Gloeophyllum trabeum ATCC 11539]|uniref:NAD P-binding protein n=1 Tax=Gloeophyllum trabeum (strain ATCC 11539 / FP-39264 / Madison 617) TaxID=670483 RepID=S7S1E9_GLOTA|nr:NAD P-binding protein [Gloeophyllum trabeum ATCC 11539]EPQ59569.1 NAD P-binding protein [Gloeophyllum trabeum ATCC 11539]
MPAPFILVAPASRGIGLGLARHYLRTTSLPVYATHRARSPSSVKARILDAPHLDNVDKDRLRLLDSLELTDEASIKNVADKLAADLKERGGDDHAGCIHRAWFCAGILHPEKRFEDLDNGQILQTFKVNVVSHLLAMKHFSRFLPPRNSPSKEQAKWIHISARVGSVSDNKTLGGWPSYRCSKAALNQAIRTFDLNLKTKKLPAICAGIHPGTVHTDLDGGAFWHGPDPARGKFELPDAVERIARVVEELDEHQRGRVWDWKAEEVLP